MRTPSFLSDFQSVWFSRYGTLVETLETFVQNATQGYFADVPPHDTPDT